MGQRDPRVDEYIARSARFAKPILIALRDAVHAACPGVTEDMKWRFPHFMYKGMLCSMAAFKEHAAFGFWKGALVIDDKKKRAEAMGHLGRLTSIADLPPRRVLTGYVRRAAALNDQGIVEPRARSRAAVQPPRVPPALAVALGKNRKARATFDRFPPGQQREYVDWIVDAKTAPTRQRRLEQAVAWMAEGKRRNWRYEK